MRRAEFVTAFILALLAIYIMWKSGEGPEWDTEYVRYTNTAINIDGSGPGKGFWPFYLSLIMFFSSVATALTATWRLLAPNVSEDQPQGWLNPARVKLLLVIAAVAVAASLGASVFGEGADGEPTTWNMGKRIVWTCGAILALVLVDRIVGSMRAGRLDPSEPFLDGFSIRMLLLVGGGLAGFLYLVDVISMYGAIAVFLLYYLLFLGRHPLVFSIVTSIVVPYWLYLFFDILMRLPQPKGIRAIDDGFYAPLGKYFRELGQWPMVGYFALGIVVLLLGIYAGRRSERS